MNGARSKARWVAVLLLAGAVLAGPGAARAESLTMGGSGWSLGIMRELAAAYTRRHPEVSITIPASVGSAGGVRAVLAGTFDAAFSGRPLSAAERAEGAVATPVFRTPFVLAVSTAVAGRLSLTREEVVKAFDLAIPAWPDGTPLRVVFRPASESANDVLIAAFPGIAPVLDQGRKRRGAIVLQTDQDVMKQGEQVPGTLIPNALVGILAERRALKPVAIDGVVPSAETLADGRYPMEVALRIVLGPKSGATVRDFIGFVRSAEGREIMLRYGALPVDGADG
ncbi:MAG TPA: substrate-binding domain-containing protein [Azospirillum sp.]|nr:substrate-binding domain-containing protein [Azospirillum sp.]